MKRGMRLIRRLKKLSASQKKLKTENLAKNGMPNLLAYIYGRIVVIPFTGISGDVQIALHSSRFMPRSRRGWSVSNLPFVKMAGFWVKIACFAIGDKYFTYHFKYKMVS